jgi:hypothetical protein
MKNTKNLYQKKFYSDAETDDIVESHAKKSGMGYSESLREIVLDWHMLGKDTIAVNIDGVIKNGKVIWREGMKPIDLEEELARR